jgi:hypothetical protein
MNKLTFKIIVFFIFINISNCSNNNIEKMIRDFKKEFKSFENNVNTKLTNFKKEKNEGLLLFLFKNSIKYKFF